MEKRICKKTRAKFQVYPRCTVNNYWSAFARSSRVRENEYKEYEGKIVLVTGGAGCIGTNLCRKLVESGARVIILDDLSSTNGMSQSSIWQLISQTSDGTAGERIAEMLAPCGM